MKLHYALLISLICVTRSIGEKDKPKCGVKGSNVTEVWLDMDRTCADKLETQIKTEIKAALTYLAMGTHFARDKVNRLGFSKFFFEAANEEREHAIKIIEYLLMRGQIINNFSFLKDLEPHKQTWTNGVDALQDALKLEASVTRDIRDIIITCENPGKPAHKAGHDSNIAKSKSAPSFNDYHLVDYLTGDFLDEQYKGQRDIAGKISTLNKMMATQASLGEFLFDKKLLNGEV